MHAPSLRTTRSARWMVEAAVGLSLWTAFGILSSAHFFMGAEATGRSASFGSIAGRVLLFYWAWAALTPLLLWVLRRADRRELLPQAGILAGVMFSLVVAHGVLYLALVRLVGLEAVNPISRDGLITYAMLHGGGDVATLAVLVAIHLLFEARRRAHQRQIAATSLAARLAIADLEVLRWQLQPHFLCNALNTVSTLVLKGDERGADAAITLIARYLRSALAQRADEVVTVSDEVCGVEEYFAIERLRFGDALSLDVRVAADAQHVRMPALILQPLVENAVRHGLNQGAGATSVGVAASVSAGRLRLQVSDPALADDTLPRPARREAGFGLRYVRERLQHFYGADARLTLGVSTDGTCVTVDVPSAPGTPARA